MKKYIEEFNKKSIEKAKKYGLKPLKFNFNNFMR